MEEMCNVLFCKIFSKASMGFVGGGRREGMIVLYAIES